jgi:FAD/FMN-containing dehydrogenase
VERSGNMSLEFKHMEKFKAAFAQNALFLGDAGTQLSAPKYVAPETITELAGILRSSNRLEVGGSNPYRMAKSSGKLRFAKNSEGKFESTQSPSEAPPTDGTILLDKLDKVLAFSPADQIISVEAGMLLSNLNRHLEKFGYEIPVGLQEGDQEECIGDLVALNLPHWNMAKGGSWRDWIVKMKIVLASGEIVVSGADVVKSVSGFDLHKLMIGARHTLGVIAEITLRIKPKSLPREYPPILEQHGELVLAIPSNFRRIMERLQPEVDKGSLICFTDEESGLILAEQTRMFEDIPHFSWRSHVYEHALPEFSEAEQKLMKRTKEIFDPTYKLNPGEFGFI